MDTASTTKRIVTLNYIINSEKFEHICQVKNLNSVGMFYHKKPTVSLWMYLPVQHCPQLVTTMILSMFDRARTEAPWWISEKKTLGEVILVLD